MKDSMDSELRLFQEEVTVDGRQSRLWSLERETCPELTACRMARLGVDVAVSPYQRVRLRPEGSFFLACLEGEGDVLLEGNWQRVKTGSLCLAPPRVLNALRAVPGKRWVFAWVRYDEPHWSKPLVGADSPLRLTDGAEELGRMISGLRAEWEREEDRDPAQVHHWVSLIHGQIKRLASPWRSGSRVAEVWRVVANDLVRDWKLTSLAEACHMSGEHLRRLCLRELGRTPMEHVTYMRIQRAKHMLESTEDKLENIAAMVGYKSGTVFSRAFMRCVGMTPTAYRLGGGGFSSPEGA